MVSRGAIKTGDFITWVLLYWQPFFIFPAKLASFAIWHKNLTIKEPTAMLSSGLSAQYTYVLEQFTILSIAFVYISNQLLLYFQLFPFLQQLKVQWALYTSSA